LPKKRRKKKATDDSKDYLLDEITGRKRKTHILNKGRVSKFELDEYFLSEEEI
jgi:hypothetical protein